MAQATGLVWGRTEFDLNMSFAEVAAGGNEILAGGAA
jgi:hypothetical protein